MKNITVIGGGISGLATAYLIKQQAAEKNLAVNVQLIEQEARVGGKFWSRKTDGYLCEWGPNGFLTNKPQTLELCQKLGISEKLLSSNDNARKRFVYSNGKLHQLPHNQLEFLSNSLISWGGKLRIAGEFFIPKRTATSDESLSDFTRRRLGQEALNKLIAPMAGGVFAGNPDTMSLKACFPRIYQLEQEYGGLLKAMLRLMNAHRKAQKSGEVVASPAGPGGVLTSFVNGVEELSNALAASFNSTEIIKSSAVRAIEQNEDKTWQIITAENSYTADCVVCATPAYASAKLVANLDQQLSQQLAQIHYAPLAVVCLGYAAADVNFDVNGFGYLLARGEEVPILGTLWDSSIFAARAPDGKILFRSMLGGAARPELLKLDDAELVQLVRDSLAKILGVSTPPEMVQVFRHLQAIPEYRVGHPELVAEIMSQAKTHPGLFISGNAYYGVGINDCVAQAYKVSQSLCEYVAQNQ